MQEYCAQKQSVKSTTFPQAAETINPYRRFRGAMVPEWLMRRPEVSPGAKLLYARLARYAGRRGVAFPSEPTLATELGVSERQIRRYVVELRKQGLVVTFKRQFAGVLHYRFVKNPWMPIYPDTYVRNADAPHTGHECPDSADISVRLIESVRAESSTAKGTPTSLPSPLGKVQLPQPPQEKGQLPGASRAETHVSSNVKAMRILPEQLATLVAKLEETGARVDPTDAADALRRLIRRHGFELVDVVLTYGADRFRNARNPSRNPIGYLAKACRQIADCTPYPVEALIDEPHTLATIGSDRDGPWGLACRRFIAWTQMPRRGSNAGQGAAPEDPSVAYLRAGLAARAEREKRERLLHVAEVETAD